MMIQMFRGLCLPKISEDRNTFLRDRPGTKDETVQVVPGLRSKMCDQNTLGTGLEEDVD